MSCSTSLRSSPSPTMMPDLVKIVGSISLARCRRRIGVEVARARPHGEVFRRHRLEIVVEHVGTRGDDGLQRPVLAQEVGRQHLDRGAGRARADGADDVGEVPAAAVRQVVAVDRRDRRRAQAELGDRDRRRARARADRGPRGSPVLTLQKAQARVQVSPMIMKVACFFSQHSPILGQPASSQTVTSLFSRTMRLVSAHCGEPGALTRIQSGLRCTG